MLEEELEHTNATIFHLTHQFPQVARLPGNRADFPLLMEIQRLRLATVLATADPGDDLSDPAALARKVLDQASNGGVIRLSHPSLATVKALPLIISELEQRGYRFVTISELAQFQGLNLASTY